MSVSLQGRSRTVFERFRSVGRRAEIAAESWSQRLCCLGLRRELWSPKTQTYGRKIEEEQEKVRFEFLNCGIYHFQLLVEKFGCKICIIFTIEITEVQLFQNILIFRSWSASSTTEEEEEEEDSEGSQYSDDSRKKIPTKAVVRRPAKRVQSESSEDDDEEDEEEKTANGSKRKSNRSSDDDNEEDEEEGQSDAEAAKSIPNRQYLFYICLL